MFFLAEAQYYIKDCGCLPEYLTRFTNLAYSGVRIIVPIILIIIGIFTLMSSMMSQKEDDIKKAQGKLIQKVVASVLVFLVLTIVQFAFQLVTNVILADKQMNNETRRNSFKNTWVCVNYMLNGKPDMEKVTTCDVVSPEITCIGGKVTNGVCVCNSYNQQVNDKGICVDIPNNQATQ